MSVLKDLVWCKMYINSRFKGWDFEIWIGWYIVELGLSVVFWVGGFEVKIILNIEFCG